MAHPIDHAQSSASKFGGIAEDYLAIHQWFDESKSQIAGFRHRALRHHAEGFLWRSASSESPSQTAMANRFLSATLASSM